MTQTSRIKPNELQRALLKAYKEVTKELEVSSINGKPIHYRGITITREKARKLTQEARKFTQDYIVMGMCYRYTWRNPC